MGTIQASLDVRKSHDKHKQNCIGMDVMYLVAASQNSLLGEGAGTAYCCLSLLPGFKLSLREVRKLSVT